MAVELSTRFRRRLTIAFIVVAGVSAGILGVASFFIVQQYRVEAFTNRAVAQAELAVAFAARSTDELTVSRLVEIAQEREGLVAIAYDGDQTAVSDQRFEAVALPADLRKSVGEGETANREVKFGGAEYLVIGKPVPTGKVQAFFLFSLDRLHSDLDQLRNVLIGVWLAVVAAAALAGSLVARRTLVPVQAASDAARLLTEGLVESKLPLSSGDEFAAWTQYFNELATQLREKMDALTAAHDRERRFTADVAHELRTPLSGMATAATLLQAEIDTLPISAKRPAELVIADVARLRSLVLDLLEVSRLDADQETLHYEPVSLRHFLQMLAANGGWSEQVSVLCDDVTITSDRVRLDRIFNNLLLNAVTHGRPPVTVCATQEERHVSVTVNDCGSGVSEQSLPFVFDRFYKASTSRSGGGSGLGLAIALNNAQLLGGTIEVTNGSDGGALFTVRLPK